MSGNASRKEETDSDLTPVARRSYRDRSAFDNSFGWGTILAFIGIFGTICGMWADLRGNREVTNLRLQFIESSQSEMRASMAKLAEAETDLKYKQNAIQGSVDSLLRDANAKVTPLR